MTKHIDRTRHMDLQTACWRATKDQRGSIGAIAEIHGWEYNTLAHRLNPNTDTHTLGPEHIEAVLAHTRDPRIMDAMCQAHGAAVWYELPALPVGGDGLGMLTHFGELSAKVGALGQALFDALADGRISQIELDTLEQSARELLGATRLIVDAAAKKMRGDV